MWNRIKALVWKEFLQLRRDRLSMGFILGMPLMQLFIFGLAINTDVKHLPAVVYDESRSQESRDFVDGLVATQYFDLRTHVDSEAAFRKEIDMGRAQVGVWFPPDYARKLHQGATGQVMVAVDASNPTTAANAMATAFGVAQLRGSTLLFDRMGFGQATRPDNPIDVRIRPWYNPNLRSPNFIVPGLVGVILSMTCVIFASGSIVKEKERGTLDQMMVTPVTPFELFLGKVIPVVGIAYLQLSVLFGVARFFFHVPIAGSLLQLYLATAMFILPMLGIGIKISTVSDTQAQSNQLATLTFLPCVFLSGYIFPIEGMPRVFQWVSEIIPLTHYLVAVRAIVLRGVGLSAFWLPMAKLALLTVLIWGFSLKGMKRASA
jgi:ABC-2 type transport system permease protein